VPSDEIVWKKITIDDKGRYCKHNKVRYHTNFLRGSNMHIYIYIYYVCVCVCVSLRVYMVLGWGSDLEWVLRLESTWNRELNNHDDLSIIYVKCLESLRAQELKSWMTMKHALNISYFLFFPFLFLVHCILLVKKI